MKWDQIRDGRIYIRDTKPKNLVKIPVSDALAELFERIKASQDADGGNVYDLKGKKVKRQSAQSQYVFTYQGQPIKDPKGALKTACKNAKIPYGRNVPNGITFHSLRHGYGSYLMQQRTDFRTTQELLGQKDPKMTQRHTHVIDDIKKQAVNSLNWNLQTKKSMSANVS